MKFNGKIAVLKGGYSDERVISLKTSENVEQALKELGFRYVSIDYTWQSDCISIYLF